MAVAAAVISTGVVPEVLVAVVAAVIKALVVLRPLLILIQLPILIQSHFTVMPVELDRVKAEEAVVARVAQAPVRLTMVELAEPDIPGRLRALLTLVAVAVEVILLQERLVAAVVVESVVSIHQRPMVEMRQHMAVEAEEVGGLAIKVMVIKVY
jgi:hypothetical protein